MLPQPLAAGGCGSIISGFLAVVAGAAQVVAIGGLVCTGILIMIIPGVADVRLAMALMALASLSSDLTMPISWNTCVEIGKQYTATVSSTMNMLGNFAGFVAPLLGGFILDQTGNNWSIVMCTMSAAAFGSAFCWFFLEPDANRS